MTTTENNSLAAANAKVASGGLLGGDYRPTGKDYRIMLTGASHRQLYLNFKSESDFFSAIDRIQAAFGKRVTITLGTAASTLHVIAMQDIVHMEAQIVDFDEIYSADLVRSSALTMPEETTPAPEKSMADLDDEQKEKQAAEASGQTYAPKPPGAINSISGPRTTK